ncbi:MAG: hypothetical protein ACK4VN_16595 [Bacteroidales bacterium]
MPTLSGRMNSPSGANALTAPSSSPMENNRSRWSERLSQEEL